MPKKIKPPPPDSPAIIRSPIDIQQPDSLSPAAINTDPVENDIAHINATFDIAYSAIRYATRSTEFCAIVKAIQSSLALRRKILGYDSGHQSSKGSKRTVDLLG